MKDKKQNSQSKRPLSASLEDYLEAIFNLSKKSQTVRSKDIAAVLDVKRPSVTGALRLLRDRKLANYSPYGTVSLTDAGKKAAAQITRKHEILNSFFADILGLRKDVAQKTACGVEHSLGGEAVKRLLKFIEFFNSQDNNGSDIAVRFRKYYEAV